MVLHAAYSEAARDRAGRMVTRSSSSSAITRMSSRRSRCCTAGRTAERLRPAGYRGARAVDQGAAALLDA